jgi:hypothetical protein
VKPWVSGPKELLEHAIDHLPRGSAFDLRIALISTDNAVELAIKTFMGLPERARGTPGPSRKELEQASQSFPDLLDLFEKQASDRIQGFELGDIEWYHRLRNDLYHNGNGITVDRDKVDGYLQIAKVLFESLFGEQVSRGAVPEHNSLGEFILLWADLERDARDLAVRILPKTKTLEHSLLRIVDGLVAKSRLTGQFRSRLEKVARVRNSVVHGLAKPDPAELEVLTKELRDLTKELANAKE